MHGDVYQTEDYESHNYRACGTYLLLHYAYTYGTVEVAPL